jgi:predicted dithiol-disulfide oxidoreductase (DUF899 family)
MHDDPKPQRQLEHLQFPGENSAYRTARNALLDEEIALRRQIERVSAQRRALPPGGLVREDNVFEGFDLIDPLWHLLDTTPEGRGDFQPALAYS